MKRKKTEKYNLQHKRPMFFWIGMILSLLLVISAFEWQSKYDNELMNRGSIKEEIPELVYITRQDEPKPPKPKKTIIAPKLIEVDDSIEPDDIDIIIDLDDIKDDELDSLIGDIDDEPDNTIYDIFVLEKQPQPVGGLQAFYTYVARNVKYPAEAQRLGIEGRVILQFVVDKDGSLTNIEVLNSVGGGCDEEAIRVMKQAPAWNPGKQRAVPVRVRMVLPITFRLN